MQNLLSKSLIISACIFGLVIGMVVQGISDHWAVPPTTNVSAGGQPTTNTGGQPGYGIVWSSAVRLETGEIIAFDKITFSGVSSNGYVWGVASFHDEPVGDFEGSLIDGNHIKFRLKYTRQSDAIDQDRYTSQIEFDGHFSGNKAAGTVQFHDEYGQVSNGRFTLVPYQFNVIAAPPDAPDNSSDSDINGTWQGDFRTTVGAPDTIPLTLNLKQQFTPIFVTNLLYYDRHTNDIFRPNVVGTGTMGGRQVEVKAIVAGSGCNLVIKGDSNISIRINAKVTKNALKGPATLYKGDPTLAAPVLHNYEVGQVQFSR